MHIKDIPGQQESKAFLSGLIVEDRIPHAMLFTGPEGNGKLAFALAYAAALLCEEVAGLEACGTCVNCVKSLQYIHPDLHFAFPVCSKEGKKREATTSTDYLKEWRSFMLEQPYGGMTEWTKFLDSENKPFNINVTECNQIIKSLGLRRYEGRYKIQLIWSSELLGKDGNRLLKLIEEPTPDTIIILISDQQELILNTIKSRCQIFKIPPFQDEDIDVNLSEQVGDTKRRSEIVRLAAGSMRTAYHIAQSEDQEWDELFLSILRSAYTSNITGMLKSADQLSNFSKKEMEGFCYYILHFLKEYLRVVNLNSTDHARLSMQEKNTALKMIQSINAEMALGISSLMEENLMNIKRNANKKIMWSSNMFAIEDILRRKKIAS